MAIRVALLILVTGAFVALWSGDQPQSAAASVRPMNGIKENRPVSPQRPAESLSRSDRSSQRRTPLPKGIASGTYLVADRSGHTRIRVVTPEDIAHRSAAEVEMKDYYSVESDGIRWHFVRLESTIDEQTAGRPDQLRRR